MENILKVAPQNQRDVIIFVKKIVLRPPLKGGGKLYRRVGHLSKIDDHFLKILGIFEVRNWSQVKAIQLLAGMFVECLAVG